VGDIASVISDSASESFYEGIFLLEFSLAFPMEFSIALREADAIRYCVRMNPKTLSNLFLISKAVKI